MKKQSDIILLFPPHFSVFQPYPSLPVLTAFLRRAGVRCMQDDLNIKAFHYFTSREFFDYALGRAKAILAEQSFRLDSKAYKTRQLQYLSKIVKSLPDLRKRIISALSYFKTNDHKFVYEEYLRNYKTFSSLFGLVSLMYYPTFLSVGEFRTIYSPESSGDILKASSDEKMNPFIRFFNQYVTQNLKNKPLKIIGISIIGLTQMIPALTLCRILKRELPETKIVIGGVIPSQLSAEIAQNRNLFKDFFDYVICGEGEGPLFMLYQALTEGKPIEKIPNLMFVENDSVRKNNWSYYAEVENLPTPDYNGLPIDLYLTPVPVLCIETGRGCYWRKCRFCNQFFVHGKTFRPKTPTKVFSELRALAEEYNTKLFAFVNEGFPLRHMESVSREIIRDHLDIRWYASARMDDEWTDITMCNTLRKSGCCRIFFGMESGSQKVLNAMQKGIKAKSMSEIFRNCKLAGIDVFVYLMLGYPTETDDDRKKTVEMVLNNAEYIDGFYISDFTAMISSPFMKESKEIGYELVPKPELDMQYLFQHKSIVPRNEPTGQEIYEIEKMMWRKIKENLKTKPSPDIAPMYMCFKYLEESR